MELVFVPPHSTLAATDNTEEMQKASEALPGIGAALAEPMKAFWENLAAAGNPPDTIEMGLNLLFEGKAGWAIISARTEASLSLKLTWKAKPDV
ncbi:hypothetical protein FIU86_09900 [Roseovarius sp. THAF9]|uniref:CU044_2847 family protein n=1 Tax=Roseovarius sp. THAF9 TaxID=2587847 RepID=UPI001268DAAB|nr:CU044_2847 family protein [Roseovarius sp. THAF9]QFT93158.1 hypothetical protein FIU86_09900 [Roseovarius sp. THAF9]